MKKKKEMDSIEKDRWDDLAEKIVFYKGKFTSLCSPESLVKMSGQEEEPKHLKSKDFVCCSQKFVRHDDIGVGIFPAFRMMTHNFTSNPTNASTVLSCLL